MTKQQHKTLCNANDRGADILITGHIVQATESETYLSSELPGINTLDLAVNEGIKERMM